MLATGCLSGSDAGLEPADIAKVTATDLQQAPAGSRLPLRVVVRSEDGQAVVRAAVAWTIVSEPEPGGSLSDSVTLSDGTGTAEVYYRLGPVGGNSTVRAALEVDPTRAVLFTVGATRAPELTGVTPSTFEAGDVVTVRGIHLNRATAFLMGEVEVQPLFVSALGLGVTLPVPPCLAPGQVAIRAVAGNAVSEPIVGEYTSGAGTIALQAGEYVSLSPAALGGCAMFPAAGPGGAEYLIAPQSTTGVAGDSVSYRLLGSAPTPPPVRGMRRRRTHARSYAAQFDQHLRELESELATLPRPPTAAPAVAQGSVKLGQRRNFQVCSDLMCRAVEQFTTVRAEARYVGTHATIYQDVDAPANGFPEENFEELGAIFDDELYIVGTQAFGAESDVDEDGRVAILLTPVVNSLTPKDVCEESFVAGFFFALDINPGSRGDSRSNQAEVFYAIVPDPDGEVTCEFSVDQVRQRVPVTFIHEFQHMINFHQHVIVRNGNPEALWLNEAMSHLAEEIAAVHFRDLGDQTTFNRFAIGNLINAYDYLLDPGAAFTLSLQGTGTLVERGAGWMFLRFLVDRYGDDLPRRLSETGMTGAANVQGAVGAPFSQLASEWFLANWVSDLPDATLADSLKPDRLRYTSWQFRTTFGGFHEQAEERFTLPFPIVPELLTIPSFDRQGVLRAGSGEYFRAVQGASDPGFTIAFTQPGGEPLVDAVPRVSGIRIR